MWCINEKHIYIYIYSFALFQYIEAFSSSFEKQITHFHIIFSSLFEFQAFYDGIRLKSHFRMLRAPNRFESFCAITLWYMRCIVGHVNHRRTNTMTRSDQTHTENLECGRLSRVLAFMWLNAWDVRTIHRHCYHFRLDGKTPNLRIMQRIIILTDIYMQNHKFGRNG